ncbi:OmpA family protein [Sphingobacterium sp. 18053]|uniref:OmpA family protein n=1 Tax=Sphingobacterium sp. 18053 TaxID=2681401 RepID=UPI00135C6FFB|nr:OmpA family protein [Sphingobacterium sp. 18053]
MFKRLFYVIIALQVTAVSASGQGFLKRLGERAANAGSDLLIKKSTQKAEKVIDGNQSKKSKEGNGEKIENGSLDNNETQKSTKQLSSSYSRYDFIPGEKIILFDNFEQDAIGEFPMKWFTTGSGEVVKLEGKDNKWLQFNSGNMLSPTMKLPENFTVEFDLVVNLSTRSSAVFPGFKFELFDRGDKAKRLDSYNYTLKNILYFSNSFDRDKAVVRLDSRENAKQKLLSDKIFLKGFQSNYGSVVHVAISIQKTRVRLWYNAEKVLDIPTAAAFPANYNQMLFVGGKTGEGYPAFFITNLRVAAGMADMRSKLLEGENFVTNGILFDSNSDRIKPESMGLIKEIASVIKESSGAKIKIVGHTDTDGNADSNLELSKKRAISVKTVLSKEFDVDASLLFTDGKGAAEPVASNTTPTGKSENRRVEFIKM